MATVTISKREYAKLRQREEAYKKLTARFFELALKDPISDIVEDFRKTGLYTKEFLGDLEDGLRKSSYAKKR